MGRRNTFRQEHPSGRPKGKKEVPGEGTADAAEPENTAVADIYPDKGDEKGKNPLLRRKIREKMKKKRFFLKFFLIFYFFRLIFLLAYGTVK